MTLDQNDVQISSTVGAEKDLFPYFPTLFHTGQSTNQESDINIDYVASSGTSYSLDNQVEASTSAPDITYRNNTYNTYEINTDLYNQELNCYFDTKIADIFFYRENLIITKFNTNIELNWSNNTKVSYYNNVNFRYILNDLTQEIKLYFGVATNHNDLVNDIYFSKSKLFICYSDIYCSNMGMIGNLINDVEVGVGRIGYMLDDIYCASKNSIYTYTDIYSSNFNTINIQNDIENTLGSIVNISNSIYSSGENIKAVACDIRLNSLHITNFSLHYEDYTYVGEYLYVDILDFIFTIKTEDSYFEVGGARLNTEFEVIENGVRARCIIGNEFISDKELEIKVTASNLIGDIFYAYYYILYGYSIELNDNILFDYNSNVIVHSCATNEVECPNTECSAFTFTTIDYPSYNLQASISCVVIEDLSASIVPQSTAFFYGSSYKITISNIKDHSGNYLDPVIMEFTIEDNSLN